MAPGLVLAFCFLGWILSPTGPGPVGVLLAHAKCWSAGVFLRSLHIPSVLEVPVVPSAADSLQDGTQLTDVVVVVVVGDYPCALSGG